MLPALAELKETHHAPSRSAVIVRAVELYLREHTDWEPTEVGRLP